MNLLGYGSWAAGGRFVRQAPGGIPAVVRGVPLFQFPQGMEQVVRREQFGKDDGILAGC